MAGTLTYVESLRRTLHQLMHENPDVVVLGEDLLDPYGGAFKVTKGLSTHFPERVLATPICEASIIGVATGMALFGIRPIAEIMFGDFMTLAADQLVNHATKYRSMYGEEVSVPLVVRTPMGGGRGYGPTHSQSLEKLFLGIPNLTVVAPSHFHDPGDFLRRASAAEAPVLFVENKLLYPRALRLDGEMGSLRRSEVSNGSGFPSVVLKNYEAPQRADVAVITYGGISRLLEPALQWLTREEIRVVVCVVGALNPLDTDHILDCASESQRVLIIEEGTCPFGWGAEVSAQIYDEMYDTLKAPLKRVGALDTVIPAAKTLEDQVLVSEETIITAVLELIQW
ncbi:MAG: transketolase C-terminal domain-containing protein [Candidatus Promineifilaceae bacterium]|nr:transketolase C-terminal domain-containing protein [Candidatus Promineifilaceae bacterium]